MTPLEARSVLERLADRHRQRLAVAGTVAALAIGALAGPALGHALGASTAWQAVTGVFVLAVGLAGLVARLRLRPVDARAVARHLDQAEPRLQASTELLLAPAGEAGLLDRLQRERVAAAFSALDPALLLPRRGERSLWTVAAMSIVVAIPLLLLGPAPRLALAGTPVAERVVATEQPAPWITAATAEIVPPAYTRRPTHRARDLDLDVEEGARVTWRVTTNRRVDGVRLVGTGGVTLPFEPVGSAWTLRLPSATRSLVYHVELLEGDSARATSPDHRLTVRPDAEPVLAVVRPDQRTTVPHTGAMQVPVEVIARDDYGIDSVMLAGTVTTGRGEGVKFRQVALPFTRRTPQGDALLLTRTLDLRALGLGPGDELYFHVEATDIRPGTPNHGRSETVFLTVPDTGSAATAEFSGFALTLPPEYFRSQRQIIIDTEKLLAEAPRLPDSVFRDRANGIGIDQGLLRLRYGEFLGDEFEGGVPGHAPGEEEHEEPDTGEEEAEDPAAEFTHTHDAEENATLLGASVKTKLKAAVSEMWQAELYLRTARPREALPFEYRALVLLKEVQQDARAYVKRVGFEPPPLEPDRKRLTGDLTGVRPPVQVMAGDARDTLPAVRAALRAIQPPGNASAEQVEALEAAGQEMAALAVEDPTLLPLLRDVRALIDATRTGSACPGCRERAELAFRRVLPPALPEPASGGAGGGLLERAYRDALRRGGTR